MATTFEKFSIDMHPQGSFKLSDKLGMHCTAYLSLVVDLHEMYISDGRPPRTRPEWPKLRAGILIFYMKIRVSPLGIPFIDVDNWIEKFRMNALQNLRVIIETFLPPWSENWWG
jgi:hypothetical protein